MEATPAPTLPDIINLPVPRQYMEHISISGTVYLHMMELITRDAIPGAMTEQTAEIKRLNETMTQAASTIEQQRAAITEMAAKNQQQSEKLREAVEVERQNALLQATHTEAMQYIQGLHEALERVFKPLLPGQLSPEMVALYNVWQKKTPPVIVPPPVDPKPVPAAHMELPVTIVDNGSYGANLTARLKGYLDKIKASNIKHVMLFQNKQQVVDDEFPKQILDRGLQWHADTFWSVWRTTTPPERVAYLEAAERMQVQGWHFDDAHNNTPDDLAVAVKFMRGYTDKPIYGSFSADDARIKDGKRETFDMQAYKDAGLLITRQFFRQGETVSVLDTWLKSGRILDGVNLEAFEEGNVTTSPAEFEAMARKCLAAGVKFLSVYTVIEGAKWQMWDQAPALWAKVNEMALMMRELQTAKTPV